MCDNHDKKSTDPNSAGVVEAKALPFAATIAEDFRKLRAQFPVPESLNVDIADLPEDNVLDRTVDILYWEHNLQAEFIAHKTAGGRSGYAVVKERA